MSKYLQSGLAIVFGQKSFFCETPHSPPNEASQSIKRTDYSQFSQSAVFLHVRLHKTRLRQACASKFTDFIISFKGYFLLLQRRYFLLLQREGRTSCNRSTFCHYKDWLDPIPISFNKKFMFQIFLCIEGIFDHETLKKPKR